jgi:SAM-dependent methyltransferase
MKAASIKKTVIDSYRKIAKSSGCCCSCNSNNKAQKQSGKMGYSQNEMDEAPQGSNLGLGCGNPTAIASLKEGEVVLDLGCGAGFDAFLASSKVGKTGKVIGVDMADEMLEKAKENAKKNNYFNVEFKKGDIESLPINDSSIDAIISNCVINLAPDKKKVFKEAYRVLKTNGRLMVSDVVLTKPLPEEIKNDERLLVGCVSGVILKKNYLNLLRKSGFSDIAVHKETPGFLEDYTTSITYSAYKK